MYMCLNFTIYIKIILVFYFNICFSQSSNIPKNIKTIILKNSKSVAPYINLEDSIELSFDDLEADEKSYYFQVNHFDYTWNPSKLNKAEFLNGFDDLRIKNYYNSFNTLQPYTNYYLKIPNEELNFKISGNYSLSIHLANGNKVFEKKFSIFKDEIPIQISISKSNSIKNINTDQRIKVVVNCNNCTNIYSNSSKLKLVIIKNNNWLSSIVVNKPKYILSNKLIYEDIFFDGGNEFFHFDNSNIYNTNLRIYRSTLNNLYNNFLTTDKERTKKIYEYNPDINGEFVVASNNNSDSNIENDYARVFFNLRSDRFDSDRTVYIIGRFNDFMINENYKLSYNQSTKTYEGSFLFKQGFYNYKYAFTHKNNLNQIKYFYGNYWQTENSYRVLLYQKKINDKYYKIIGSSELSSINIKN